MDILKVGNVLESHKDFTVHITLKNKEVYTLSFRRNPDTDTIHQLSVFQNQWVNDEWGYMPKMLDTQMYLNTITNELELHNKHNVEVPSHCILVTYEMFDNVKWAGFFKYPPR